MQAPESPFTSCTSYILSRVTRGKCVDLAIMGIEKSGLSDVFYDHIYV
ncbi:MAG: hypothetical protein IPO71_09835 [Nitrosomonas sp.]|nr:hypothetical protein [Nitrosomonas sp.]